MESENAKLKVNPDPNHNLTRTLTIPNPELNYLPPIFCPMVPLPLVASSLPLQEDNNSLNSQLTLLEQTLANGQHPASPDGEHRSSLHVDFPRRSSGQLDLGRNSDDPAEMLARLEHAGFIEVPRWACMSCCHISLAPHPPLHQSPRSTKRTPRHGKKSSPNMPRHAQQTYL